MSGPEPFSSQRKVAWRDLGFGLQAAIGDPHSTTEGPIDPPPEVFTNNAPALATWTVQRNEGETASGKRVSGPARLATLRLPK